MGEIEPAEFLGEGAVSFDRVIADGEYLSAEGLELAVVRPQGG
jgi:hypothetical protein